MNNLRKLVIQEKPGQGTNKPASAGLLGSLLGPFERPFLIGCGVLWSLAVISMFCAKPQAGVQNNLAQNNQAASSAPTPAGSALWQRQAMVQQLQSQQAAQSCNYQYAAGAQVLNLGARPANRQSAASSAASSQSNAYAGIRYESGAGIPTSTAALMRQQQQL